MKKPSKYLPLFALYAGILGAFLLPTLVFAQSTGHFALITQSDLSTVLPFSNSQSYVLQIGNGYSGTTTGAFVAVSYNNTLATSPIARVSIEGYSDSNYVTPVSQCQFNGENNPTGFYVATSSNPFLQLSTVESTLGSGCGLQPQNYYQVTVENRNQPIAFAGTGSATFNPNWTVVSGTEPNFFPMFALVTDGFQITPTASSTGLFLSGANAFCAGTFGSSTAPGIVTDVGIALCNVVGYAFVPTPTSIQQFGNFTPTLQSKIPFSYFYDVQNIFTESIASSSSNMVAYTMPLAELDFASSTGLGPILPDSFTFFSTTTISQYLPAGMYDVIYGLMTAAIWVEVLFLLYRKIVPSKAKI